MANDPRSQQTGDPREALFRDCATKLAAGDDDANRLLAEISSHTDYAPGWRRLGKTLHDLRRFEAAIVALDTALAATPGEPTASLYKAETLFELGRLVEADAVLAPERINAGQAGAVAHSRGRIAYADGRLADARAHLEHAVSAAPRIASAWFRAGLACHALGDYMSGAQYYRQARAREPQMFEAALNEGICHQTTGAINDALAAYALAYQLEPSCLGRIAHALTTGASGRLWLNPDALAAELRGLVV
ncbi:tetratricopeptide repeat protein [Salinisphaera orenii]|uniref:tetratricopeptide repeat protein n=1 Tax=Salinisphaera orenii TaxID=856731 RepID=UPI000DBE915A